VQSGCRIYHVQQFEQFGQTGYLVRLGVAFR
jgi:hypothetical protein